MCRTKPTAVIMAKWPTPGKVNTRLITESFTAESAAAAATAFLRCTTLRLHQIFHGNIIIATTPDEAIPEMKQFIRDLFLDNTNTTITVLPQNTGDLGKRMERIWQIIINNQKETTKQTTPVCFFGMDSPDIPTSILHSLRDGLIDNDIVEPFDLAAGPTDDGGYWTLAATKFHPEVLRNMQWGGDTVFQDTQNRAESAGLRFHTLEKWYDIDTPDDLTALLGRLTNTNNELNHDPNDKPLVRLHKELLNITAK